MEGLLLILSVIYLVLGCTYYVANIRRIVSFIMKMNIRHILDHMLLIILLMTLIVVWPIYLYHDLKETDYHEL